VISIGGTASFEAAFYKKPSIIMTDLGYAILPSVQKLNSLEELPFVIRNSLETKVNSDDLDRYLSILDEHSFDFDLKGYEISETNFFMYGGNYHDTMITNEKMKSFLDENQNLFDTLTNQHIKKLNYFKK
jgi:hypothetical protein